MYLYLLTLLDLRAQAEDSLVEPALLYIYIYIQIHIETYVCMYVCIYLYLSIYLYMNQSIHINFYKYMLCELTLLGLRAQVEDSSVEPAPRTTPPRRNRGSAPPPFLVSNPFW